MRLRLLHNTLNPGLIRLLRSWLLNADLLVFFLQFRSDCQGLLELQPQLLKEVYLLIIGELVIEGL